MGKVLAYFVYLSFVLFFTYSSVAGSENFRFYALTSSLLVYNIAELIWLHQHNNKYYFINPVFIGAIMNFVLFLGGTTNFLMMDSSGMYNINSTCLELTHERFWLVNAMGYINLAAFSMWLGYKTTLGRKLAHIPLSAFQIKRFLGDNVNVNLLLFLAFLGYAFKLILLKQGLYGAFIDESYKSATSFTASQVRFLRSFSTLPFILLTIQYFRKRTKYYRNIFIVTLLLEIIFAFIQGSRSPILMVFIVLFFSYYYTFQTLNYKYVILLIVPLYIAFTLAQEFKQFAYYTNIKKVNPITLFQNYLKYRSGLTTRQKEFIYDNVYQNAVGRMNYVSETSMAIRHKEIYGLDPEDPDFKKSLLFSPIDAFVPKFIQGIKNPLWGNWFRIKVLKQLAHIKSVQYNIAFSAVGFLYFAGKLPAIMLGFFIYGIFLRSVYQFLQYGLLGFIMYMIFMSALNTFNTSVNSTITNFIRYIVVYPFVIYFIFKNHQIKEVIQWLHNELNHWYNKLKWWT